MCSCCKRADCKQLVTQVNVILNRRYRITGVLRVSGGGGIYQARDMHFPTVTRYVAVKEMRASSADPAVRERMITHFIRQVKLWESLQHPALPKIYDHFAEKGRAYLVMEYINGRDVEAIVNSVPEFLPVNVVCKWAIQICNTLHYLHSQQPPIIFRDLKPSNIMINQYGNAILIDLGMARVFQTNPTVGPEGYAPPERSNGGKITPKRDIYALGATLHHILTRRDPGQEPPFSFGERPIQVIDPKVPPDLEAVVMRALRARPQSRFRNALSMKEALEQCCNEPSVSV
jgi:eukaryotic-like serine/threonine-protein kinase